MTTPIRARTLCVQSLSILLASIVLCAASCTKNPTASSQSDSGETEVRIASMSPAMTVMLRDLGYLDDVVVCHDFEQVLGTETPRAGSELAWDSETLASADPTLMLFQQTSASLPDSIRALSARVDAPIFERRLDTLDDIAACMDDLYYLLGGAPERAPGEYDIAETLSHSAPSEALARAWRDRGPKADRAGRVLVLGSLSPIAAMGPGSFHHQLIERMGMTPAIVEGAMWIELSAEDLLELDPDSIVLISPQRSDEADRFGIPEAIVGERAIEPLGFMTDLPLRAVRNGRIGVSTHPLGLLPSSSLTQVARELDAMLDAWDE